MAKKQNEAPVVINKPSIKYVSIPIVGDNPLNIHRLGKKLKQERRDISTGLTVKKKNRDFDAEYIDSLYFIDTDGGEVPAPKTITKKCKFGFPSSGFKKAMISAARQLKGLSMAELRGRFFVTGEYTEIIGTPEKDEFFRRIGGKGPGTGTPDVGVRAKFPQWKAVLHIRYNSDLLTKDSLANLVETAGFSVGIGEDRPDKNGGIYGTWHVDAA